MLTFTLLKQIDLAFTATRHMWLWIGQVALVILGVHHAAVRLDELLARWIALLPIPWPDPHLHLVASVWAALALELLICAWVARLLIFSRSTPTRDLRDWWSRLTIAGLTAPVLIASAGAAGLWVVQMAIEDALAPQLPDYARWIGVAAAMILALRLLWPGLIRVLRRMPPDRPLRSGWIIAPFAWLIVISSVLHGLPIWGWLG